MSRVVFTCLSHTATMPDQCAHLHIFIQQHTSVLQHFALPSEWVWLHIFSWRARVERLGCIDHFHALVYILQNWSCKELMSIAQWQKVTMKDRLFSWRFPTNMTYFHLPVPSSISRQHHLLRVFKGYELMPCFVPSPRLKDLKEAYI